MSESERCFTPGCPGHPVGSRLKCLDPEVYGTPYDIESRYLVRAQAGELSDLRIRHLEQRVALAHRFHVLEDFKAFNSRLRMLRECRENFDVSV